MPNVAFVSQDRAPTYGLSLGGAGHYRVGLPCEALRRNGWTTLDGICIGAQGTDLLGCLPVDKVGTSYEEQAAAAVVPDVLVMQRYMGDQQADAILRARAAGQVIINDVDDLFDGLPPSNQAFTATHPKTNPRSNVNHYRKVLAASSLITVSTPYLAHRLARYGRPVVVVRNAIETARFPLAAPRTPPRLGWTGALAFRANDVEQACGAIQWGLGNGYHPEFVHVGAVPGRSLGERLGVAVEEHGMLPIDEWPTAYEHFEVGIVPLSSHPFNEAKSAIKGMEMAASGIPFVATPTPEYRWLHATHGIGLLAARHKDWVRQLRALLDPTFCAEQAEQARTAVKALDIDQQWHQWADVYANAVP